MASHSSSGVTTFSSRRVSTSSFGPADFREHLHPQDPTNKRFTVSLGDLCGLSKQGVHLCRLQPGCTSTTMHWHANDEEWYYILEAADDGAALILKSEEDKEPREEKVHKGDFIGFPAGVRTAHALRAGGQAELVYLVSGTREPMDVSTYPGVGRKLVLDRTRDEKWTVDEKDIRSM